eukprot:scaffold20556_cov34-Tisochrysis_lutea.AAC.2
MATIVAPPEFSRARVWEDEEEADPSPRRPQCGVPVGTQPHALRVPPPPQPPRPTLPCDAVGKQGQRHSCGAPGQRLLLVIPPPLVPFRRPACEWCVARPDRHHRLRHIQRRNHSPPFLRVVPARLLVIESATPPPCACGALAQPPPPFAPRCAPVVARLDASASHLLANIARVRTEHFSRLATEHALGLTHCGVPQLRARNPRLGRRSETPPRVPIRGPSQSRGGAIALAWALHDAWSHRSASQASGSWHGLGCAPALLPDHPARGRHPGLVLQHPGHAADCRSLAAAPPRAAGQAQPPLHTAGHSAGRTGNCDGVAAAEAVKGRTDAAAGGGILEQRGADSDSAARPCGAVHRGMR